MDSELKPCPFCGADLHMVQDCFDYYGPCDQHVPGCALDGADVRIHRTQSEAIAAWNRRADPTPPEIARLRGAARNIMPYLHWTVGPESPGYHPTMPSAVDDFAAALAQQGGDDGQ